MISPSSFDAPAPGRRRFLHRLGAGLGLMLGSAPLLRSEEDAPGGGRKLGVALLGLGSYSQGQLGPALQETRFCRLAGVVTGTPSKGEEWRRRYGLKAASVYSYDTFDRIAENPEIDIVYVVTPNALHADFTVRAARAGKHVLCEKPMATTVADGERMMAACRAANRQLSIGYRLHFEPHTQEVMRLAREKPFGPVRRVEAGDGFPARGGTWRFDPKLAGGGPLMDVGIYCVQAACYATGEVPVAVTAREEPRRDPDKFKEIEETLRWTMEFPSGARAECVTSYAESHNLLRVEAREGWYELRPAYSYRGIKGRTQAGPMAFPQVNQQALQMDAFAQCIINFKPTSVPGEMGLRDVKLLLAIYEAARTGRRVELALEPSTRA